MHGFWPILPVYFALYPRQGRSHNPGYVKCDRYIQQALHIIQVDNAPAHNLGSSELPDNVILLFQPPASPEVNPTERVWEYLKDFLAWSVFSNLDELRTKVQEILVSFTDRVISCPVDWPWYNQKEHYPHQIKNAKTNYDRTSSESRRSSKLVSVKLKQPVRLIITRLFGC
jgi:hypothetical protein